MNTANALARKLAEDKTLESSLRTSATDASVQCDLKGAKAFLGKFKKDKDPEVLSTVARIEKFKLKKK